MENIAKKRWLLDKNHIHYKSYRAHNPVPGRDRIVVDFDLIYLGDADIQVQADFHMFKVLNPSNFLVSWAIQVTRVSNGWREVTVMYLPEVVFDNLT